MNPMHTLEAALNKLQSEIMNIPVKYADSEFSDVENRLIYKEGHRDARHAAVELVIEFANRVDEESK